MIGSSKIFYLLISVVLILTLAGCELRREESDIADPDAMSDLPPTLAPLNAETNLSGEATAVPTVISVQATATASTLAEGEAAESPADLVAPTSIPIDLSESSAVSNEDVAEAATEDYSPPAQEPVVGESDAEEAIVVDATTSNDLPIGGPVAANPPASQSSDNYEAPAYGSTTYMVRPGDTLFSIARRYGTSVDDIIYDNGLVNDIIQAGQQLTISGGNGGGGYSPSPYEQPSYQQPPYQEPGYQQQPTYQEPPYQQRYIPDGSERFHIIAPGETLFRIAMQYGSSVDAIAAANGIPYPYIIQEGQQLLIPRVGPVPPGSDYSQQPYPYQEPNQYQQPQPQYQEPNQYQQPYPYQQPDQYQQPYQSQQPYQGYAPQQPSVDNYAAPQEGYYPPQDNPYVNPNVAGTHTIAPGETLYSIAQRYNTSAEALSAANGLSNPNEVFVGQVLYLP